MHSPEVAMGIVDTIFGAGKNLIYLVAYCGMFAWNCPCVIFALTPDGFSADSSNVPEIEVLVNEVITMVP